MRPGLVFVGLFAVLIVIYALLQDTLGSTATLLLQSAIVIVILGAAAWFRRVRSRRGWSLFRDEPEAKGPEQAGASDLDGDSKQASDATASRSPEQEESAAEVRRAS